MTMASSLVEMAYRWSESSCDAVKLIGPMIVGFRGESAPDFTTEYILFRPQA